MKDGWACQATCDILYGDLECDHENVPIFGGCSSEIDQKACHMQHAAWGGRLDFWTDKILTILRKKALFVYSQIDLNNAKINKLRSECLTIQVFQSRA
jgi:hypothetical protein